MISHIIKLGFVLKILLILKLIVYRSNVSNQAVYDISPGLDTVLDGESGTFQILNERNVSLVLSPAPCTEQTQVLLLVSSGHDNVVARSRWRQSVSAAGLRLVFLVSACDQCDHDLASEHALHGDIVHTSLRDGHRRLGYKILSGYVWTWLHCPGVRHTVKTDDNVVLDLGALVSTLHDTGADNDNVVCGCGPPHRNMKTKRSDKPRMLGNWSAPQDQLESDYVPDFCAGFLYIISPSLGSRLVTAGAKMFGDYQGEIVLIEDMMITGVLRESLGTVGLDLLGSTKLRWLWRGVLSQCPWLTVAKMTFFDELVVSKTSDRSGVQYVGAVTDAKVWKFFICLHLEVVFINIENMIGSLPDFLWDICQRK